MKNQKGITLVALIITIIVMVILAGVAISLVVGDKGVLSQAEIAEEKQVYATAKEKVLMQSQYTNEGKIDLNNTLKNIELLNLEEVDYTKTKINDNILTVTFKNGEILQFEEKVTKADIWSQRGISNVVLDEVYSSADGVESYKLNSDGSTWQNFSFSGEQDIPSETIEELIENETINIGNNVFESPSQGFKMEFQGNKILFNNNGTVIELILQED